MNLTKEEVAAIIRKVHGDLDLYHDNNYPVIEAYYDKDRNEKFDYWVGGYDYSHPIGDDGWGKYPEYIITIDDEKKEAVRYSYYTGHYEIRLNAKGNYEVVKQLYRGE
jgi:hypothetical protein